MRSSVPPDIAPSDRLGEQSTPSGAVRSRIPRSVVGRLRTMALIVAIVVGMLLLMPRPNTQAVLSVDARSIAAQAEPRLGFEPAVPLPAGWSVTEAELRNSGDGMVTWHIGYRTAEGNFAGIEQARRAGADREQRWESILSSGGVSPYHPRPDLRIVDGRTWEHVYKDVRDVHALIYRGEGQIIMVTSKVGGEDEAVTLARSLPATAR